MRTIGFVLLWLAGSGAAIGVAWTGVAVVDNEIIDPAPAADFTAAASQPSTRGTLSSPTTEPGDASPRAKTDSADPTATPTSAASEADGTPVVIPAAQVETLTFTLIGGSTAIAFSPQDTQVLWATGNPGFDVKVSDESPGIKVEFRSDAHRSRIDAWWSNGPQQDIREEPDN